MIRSPYTKNGQLFTKPDLNNLKSSENAFKIMVEENAFKIMVEELKDRKKSVSLRYR